MKKLYYFIIALLLGSCQAESEFSTEESPIVRTKVSELQYSESEKIDLETVGIIGGSKIVKKDQLYVVLTPQGSYRFSIYNSANGKVTRLVPAGNSAGEGLYYISLNLNGDVASAFDFGTGRLVEIDLNEYATPGYQPTFTSMTDGNKSPCGAIRVGDQLISTGIYTQGRYCCTSQTTGSDKYSVCYPACADPNLTDTLRSVLFASNSLAVNPSLTRLACANMQNGCLDICEINGNELTRLHEVHLNTPRVTFHRGRPKGRGYIHPVAYSRNNIFGFCDLAVSEEYIFALYSGRTLKQYNQDVDKGETIVVFDWNGSHVRTYQLETPCSSISYDAAGNTIYALSQENGKREIITLNID